jgi:hypothetical protein
MKKYRVAFKLYNKADDVLSSNDNFVFYQETSVIAGFRDAVMDLDIGQETVKVIKSEHAYGKRGQAPYVDGGSDLKFWIKLISLEIDPATLDESERERICNEIKAKGGLLFKEGKFEQAIDLYTDALRFASLTPIQVILKLNVATCLLKLSRWQQVISHIDHQVL